MADGKKKLILINKEEALQMIDEVQEYLNHIWVSLDEIKDEFDAVGRMDWSEKNSSYRDGLRFALDKLCKEDKE